MENMNNSLSSFNIDIGKLTKTNSIKKDIEKVIENLNNSLIIKQNIEKAMENMNNSLITKQNIENDSLNWIYKTKPQLVADITMKTLQKCKKPYISFVIRNNKDKELTQSGYIAIAISNNRLYFKESDKEHGYKITVKHNNGYVNIMNKKLINWAKDKNNDFELKYNPTYKLFYIDISCPIQEK